jgi:hypothetical protein
VVAPAADESVQVGSSFTITVDVTLFPNFARSPWNNQSRATGNLAQHGTADEDTVDLSDDGSDTDTNGNGDPRDPGEDDPTPLPPFGTGPNPIPASGPFGIALLVLSIALLGWGRLKFPV